MRLGLSLSFPANSREPTGLSVVNGSQEVPGEPKGAQALAADEMSARQLALGLSAALFCFHGSIRQSRFENTHVQLLHNTLLMTLIPVHSSVYRAAVIHIQALCVTEYGTGLGKNAKLRSQ